MTGEDFTKSNEACRLTAYLDTLGIWTIGWGHTEGVQEGDTCTQGQADAWFDTEYREASEGAARDVGEQWDGIDEFRQAALADMAYELGAHGLSGFKNMLLNIRAGYWITASKNALDSLWAKQVPNRAERVAHIIATGQWP